MQWCEQPITCLLDPLLCWEAVTHGRRSMVDAIGEIHSFFQKSEICVAKGEVAHLMRALSPGRTQMWAAHRRWGWHLLERWDCWQGWPRRFPLRRPPQGPERPPSRRDCRRSPRSGHSEGVVEGEVETLRKVEVPVPPDRQHYPESPVGGRREGSVRSGEHQNIRP